MNNVKYSTIIVKITIKENEFFEIEAAPSDIRKIEWFFTFQDYSNCFVYGKFKQDRIENKRAIVKDEKRKTLAFIPIGLLNDLVNFLDEKKAIYKVIDDRKNLSIFKKNISTESIKNSINYVDLYDFQIQAVKECIKKGIGIINLPTGSGKTCIFISLCKLVGIRTLVLFSRVELLKQTYERMKDSDVDCGMVQGKFIDENHMITLSTIQSSHKITQMDYKMVIVDECHKAKAEQYQNMLSSNIFQYRFGFSATPFSPGKMKKWDNTLVKMWLGDIIYSVDAEKLLENKVIAQPFIEFYIMNKPDISHYKKWSTVEKYGIIKNSYRNNFIAKLVNNLSGKVLVLCQKIEHGDILNGLINGCKFICGTSDRDVREKVLKEFETGTLDILIGSSIADEGLDLKKINHIVLTGGGRAYGRILQRVGRGTRIIKDDTGEIIKDSVNIHDFYDDTHKFLKKQSEERIKTYKSYGYTEIQFKNTHPTM